MSHSSKVKIYTLTNIDELNAKIKKKGFKKVIFTSGTFDMIHIGQMRYLSEGKKLGDCLVVGVNSNEAVWAVKGKDMGKPIFDERIRAECLMYLKSVNYVIIMPEPSVKPALMLLKPDIFMTVGEDWNKHYKESKEYKYMKTIDKKIIITKRQSEKISTTQVVEKIVSSYLKRTFKSQLSFEDVPLHE